MIYLAMNVLVEVMEVILNVIMHLVVPDMF